MVVHHPSRLHERVANCRTHECKSAAQQVLAHGVGFRRSRRHVRHSPPRAAQRMPAREPPDVGVERSELLLHFQESPCVFYGCRDLEAIAHNARITHQRRGAFLRIAKPCARQIRETPRDTPRAFRIVDQLRPACAPSRIRNSNSRASLSTGRPHSHSRYSIISGSRAHGQRTRASVPAAGPALMRGVRSMRACTTPTPAFPPRYVRLGTRSPPLARWQGPARNPPPPADGRRPALQRRADTDRAQAYAARSFLAGKPRRRNACSAPPAASSGSISARALAVTTANLYLPCSRSRKPLNSGANGGDT